MITDKQLIQKQMSHNQLIFHFTKMQKVNKKFAFKRKKIIDDRK